MKNNCQRVHIYYFSLFIALICIAGCNMLEMPPTPDATAMEEAIQQRVMETLTALPTSTPDQEMINSLSNISQTATAYVEAEPDRIADAVAATLTAQPTNSPMAISTPSPPPISTLELAQEALEKIRDQGSFSVGIRYEAPPFGHHPDYDPEQTDSFEPGGFDVDIVREFARLWLGDREKVTLMPVNSQTRFSDLTDGKFDLTAGAVGKTETRCSEFECSNTYLVDQPRLLVHVDSLITRLCDPRLEFFTVLTKTTAIDHIQRELENCNVVENPKIEQFDSRKDAIDVVVEDKFAAYVTDSTILKGWQEIYASRGENLKIVGNRFKVQENFILLVPKNSLGLLALINVTLQTMYTTERYHEFYEKSFGCDNAPSPIPTDDYPERFSEFLKGANSKRTTDSICEKCPNPYTVEKNDTFWDLAAQCLGDAEMYECIQDVNPKTEPRALLIGTELKIPLKSECSPID